MKIAKKKVLIKSPLINQIIDLERPLEKVLKKGKYIAIKYDNTPSDIEGAEKRRIHSNQMS